MFFKRKKQVKDSEDPRIKHEAEKQRQREETERKRALYEEAMLSLSAYGAWAHPADMG